MQGVYALLFVLRPKRQLGNLTPFGRLSGGIRARGSSGGMELHQYPWVCNPKFHSYLDELPPRGQEPSPETRHFWQGDTREWEGRLRRSVRFEPCRSSNFDQGGRVFAT